MIQLKQFCPGRLAALGAGVAMVLMLAGCAGQANRPPAGATFTAADMYVTPPDLQPGILVTDHYYYYPAWGVYYNTSRSQFSYLQGGAWVLGPVPPGMPINSIMASPSVKLNFRDSPTNHHAETLLKYPANWKPPTPN